MLASQFWDFKDEKGKPFGAQFRGIIITFFLHKNQPFPSYRITVIFIESSNSLCGVRTHRATQDTHKLWILMRAAMDVPHFYLFPRT